MRYDKDFFDLWESGDYTGSNRPTGRVTIDADWLLKATAPIWGNSIRGPFRYFIDISANQGTIEHELPNVRSISRDHTLSNDIATCTVTLSNQWHDTIGQGAPGSVVPDDVDVLGKPGAFWPDHGNVQSNTLWGQTPSTGAYRRNGTYNSSFDWFQAIVPYALIRTYEGYGDETKSIDQALSDGDIYQTGTWLVESVSGNTSGELVISMQDMGKLLKDQISHPPLVPEAIYPVEYTPEGKSAFDSYWEPKAKTGVTNASQGRVRLSYDDSSNDVRSGLTDHAYVAGSNPSKAVDGKESTFAISQGFASPLSAMDWFQYEPFPQTWQPSDSSYNVDQLAITPWAGGYEVYISIYENGSWQGSSTIDTTGFDVAAGTNIAYVKKISIPLALPDGYEKTVNVSLDRVYDARYIRLTFKNYYYSQWTSGAGYYRAGIRTLDAYIKNTAFIPNYGNPSYDDNWTHAMASHPVRGYWVCDNTGNVYGFGDASEYDSATFGVANLVWEAIAMAAHPSGKGYWVLDRSGRVYAFGAATDYGEVTFNPGTDPWGAQAVSNGQAFDIKATHTGNGYVVVYGNGDVRGFGDAMNISGGTNMGSYKVWSRGITAVESYMNSIPMKVLYPANNAFGFIVQELYVYNICRRGVSVDTHPTDYGFWSVNGSGEVFAQGACQHFGGLLQRVYNAGAGNTFRLGIEEFTHAIRSTTTGNGYWIAFGSGHIAAYGDAVGQGPVDVYGGANPNANFNMPDNEITDWSFFRALIWDLQPDPDGTGFWLLAASGDVGAYNADFWGSPGYYGLSGFKWFEGNMKDYADMVKEFLLWAGFLLYDPGQSGSADPPVHGNIESTGIIPEQPVGGELFDKRSILDIITELKQITGYSFWVDYDGAVHYESPNWWSSGNFDPTGVRIWTDDTTGVQVPPETANSSIFIPTVSDELTLTQYTAGFNSEGLRSSIIISSDVPDFKNPTTTAYTEYIPTTATDEIRPGVPALRNIVRPAVWVNSNFTNSEEQRLMAELINLQIWFSQRTGSVEMVGNPLIGINDQVKIRERNTSEFYTHYVRGVSSNLDLQEGTYKMTLTTNWLGNAASWVITTSPSYDPVYQVQISNYVDRWQEITGRELPTTGGSSGGSELPSNIIVNEAYFAENTYLADTDWNEGYVFYADITISGDPLEDVKFTVLEQTGGMSGWPDFGGEKPYMVIVKKSALTVTNPNYITFFDVINSGGPLVTSPEPDTTPGYFPEDVNNPGYLINVLPETNHPYWGTLPESVPGFGFTSAMWYWSSTNEEWNTEMFYLYDNVSAASEESWERFLEAPGNAATGYYSRRVTSNYPEPHTYSFLQRTTLPADDYVIFVTGKAKTAGTKRFRLRIDGSNATHEDLFGTFTALSGGSSVTSPTPVNIGLVGGTGPAILGGLQSGNVIAKGFTLSGDFDQEGFPTGYDGSSLSNIIGTVTTDPVGKIYLYTSGTLSTVPTYPSTFSPYTLGNNLWTTNTAPGQIWESFANDGFVYDGVLEMGLEIFIFNVAGVDAVFGVASDTSGVGQFSIYRYGSPGPSETIYPPTTDSIVDSGTTTQFGSWIGDVHVAGGTSVNPVTSSGPIPDYQDSAMTGPNNSASVIRLLYTFDSLVASTGPQGQAAIWSGGGPWVSETFPWYNEPAYDVSVSVYLKLRASKDP